MLLVRCRGAAFVSHGGTPQGDSVIEGLLVPVPVGLLRGQALWRAGRVVREEVAGHPRLALCESGGPGVEL